MYAVIFRAEIANVDSEYSITANRMRDLAINKYGCKEFIACTEGNYEIAISYWETEAQIKKWKENVEHLSAQNKGRSRWYTSYSVQITKIIRAYNKSV